MSFLYICDMQKESEFLIIIVLVLYYLRKGYK